MGRIDDLRQSILEMTHEESLKRIRAIRMERKVNRNPAKERKAKGQRKAKTVKLASALKGMTKEQLRELGLVLKGK